MGSRGQNCFNNNTRCYFTFFLMLTCSNGAKEMVNQTAYMWHESKQGHEIVH